MSTRATYKFMSPGRPPVTVYIHHDGHPEGAATYVAAALALGPLTAENFIRANKRAEITGGHDAHGDTEYRYTLGADRVGVQPCGISAAQAAFAMPVADFVAKYAPTYAPPASAGAPATLRAFDQWLTDRMANALAGMRKGENAPEHARRFEQYRAAAAVLHQFREGQP